MSARQENNQGREHPVAKVCDTTATPRSRSGKKNKKQKHSSDTKHSVPNKLGLHLSFLVLLRLNFNFLTLVFPRCSDTLVLLFLESFHAAGCS